MVVQIAPKSCFFGLMFFFGGAPPPKVFTWAWHLFLSKTVSIPPVFSERPCLANRERGLVPQEEKQQSVYACSCIPVQRGRVRNAHAGTQVHPGKPIYVCMYVCRYERVSVYTSSVRIHGTRSRKAYPPIRFSPVGVRRRRFTWSPKTAVQQPNFL